MFQAVWQLYPQKTGRMQKLPSELLVANWAELARLYNHGNLWDIALCHGLSAEEM